ncbi:MAG: hypothetical protein ABI354_00840, partial [Candidatus Saccharimonadales bacterium]
GSAKSFTAWQNELLTRNIKSGQLLVTHRDFSDDESGPTVRQLLQDNINSGIVTVGNENDALSVEELALLEYGGENDGLAARVAQEVGATALFLLNDKGGVYDNHEQELGQVEESEWASILLMAQNRSARSEKGTGGVFAKVTAAIAAASAGIDAYIDRAGTPVEQIIAGDTGTHFVANKS